MNSRLSLLVSMLVLATALGGHALATPDLTPRVSSVILRGERRLYPMFDASGQPLGGTAWRVVRDVGNCCENYTAVTASGRILNFGGSYLRFSDTRGLSWSEVRAIEPVAGAEGAVTVAPNGDIVGMTWDPYTGDRVLSFKLEAASQKWTYSEVPLHMPFFDRPWIAAIRGPFDVLGTTYPYAVFLRGGGVTKELMHVSFNGLDYIGVSSRFLESLGNQATSRFLDPVPDPAADWNQPLDAAAIAPIAGGGALASTRDLSSCPWSITSPKGWSCFSLPDGSTPHGSVVSDSRGWLHDVGFADNGATVVYRLSTDGGRSWRESRVPLPAGYVVEKADHKANGGLGVSVVAVHAHHRDPAGDTDRDMVYKFAYDDAGVALQKLYYVGKGDQDFGQDVSASLRFDLESVGLLPDGKIVASFVDSEHLTPATAIEL
jgi:hypothetical protein